MSDKLAVYVYNVLFGDAILVEVPDGSVHRFILIDMGNAGAGKGSANQPLLDAADDIKRRTGGKIDLYIMTHEHMDHVQGLRYASDKGCKFWIDTVWMTASSALDYYDDDKHPQAKKKKFELESAVKKFQGLFAASANPRGLAALLQINSPETEECVKFIRKASHRKPCYIYQGYDTLGQHPFTETTIRILAPEEDSSVYYMSVPRFDFHGLGAKGNTATDYPPPLAGIDGRTFYDLINRMNSGCSECIFAIDQAANNTSIVFELIWRGRRLLFTGDAETESWLKIAEKTQLQPVDFIKVSHHGSRNGVPPPSVLEKILPEQRREQAVAVISTFPGTYNNVPDTQVLKILQSVVGKIHRTDKSADNPIKIEFEERS